MAWIAELNIDVRSKDMTIEQRRAYDRQRAKKYYYGSRQHNIQLRKELEQQKELLDEKPVVKVIEEPRIYRKYQSPAMDALAVLRDRTRRALVNWLEKSGQLDKRKDVESYFKKVGEFPEFKEFIQTSKYCREVDGIWYW